MIPQSVRSRVTEIMETAGLGNNEDIIIHNLGLTNMPDDAFMTEVFLMAARQNASEIPEQFKCHICGTVYETDEEIVNCIGLHMKHFLAGLPVNRDPETIQRQISHLPEEWQKEIKKSIEEYQE